MNRIVAVLLALAACRAQVPALDAAAAREALAGVFLSPPCGKRTHPQRLTLDEDGTYELEDLIAPCPEGARCVWSGIAVTSGRWELEDRDLVLYVMEQLRGPAGEGEVLPPLLRVIDGRPVALVGPARCPFEPVPGED